MCLCLNFLSKVIHCHIIADESSALETRTTTRGRQAHVQCCTKLPGGTTTVMSPT